MTNETGTSISLSVKSEQKAAAPKFNITWENDNLKGMIEPMIWAGQRRLERVRTGGNLFTPRSTQLRSDIETFLFDDKVWHTRSRNTAYPHHSANHLAKNCI